MLHDLRSSAELSAVARRLGASVMLTEREIEHIEDIQGHATTIEAGRDFLHEGDDFSMTYVVRSGWVMRYRTTADGKRQIIAFALPGDFIGLHANYERHAAFSAAALTEVELALVEPIRILDTYRNHPVVASGLDWMATTSFNIVAEHTGSLGVRPARQRILHLLLELYCRLMIVGLADDDGFASPLTQVLLGDSLGLTSVYVSKCMARLRNENLATLNGGRVRFPDIKSALHASDFDPTFLETFRSRLPLPNAVRDIAP